MITWHWKTFHELTVDELYDVLALRQEVFVIEQNCLYQDLDYQDQKAIHLLGINNNKLIAYMRVFLKGTKYPDAISFGRVLTANSERGKGLAKSAMKQLISYLEKNGNDVPAIISAQLYLKDFYENFSLKAVGEPYDEDGIPHIKMKGYLKM